MPKISLEEPQLEAISKLKNGSVLCGKTGSGKSRMALSYYFLQNGGDIFHDGKKTLMKKPENLYIITTAANRDKMVWEDEMHRFLMTTDSKESLYKNHKIIVDSWNNIKKYVSVDNSFFIFDEQRVIGSGTWAKSFIQICRNNRWIMLTATPGDNWLDYCTLFIAEGFFRNRTEFMQNHVIFSQFTSFRKVDRYIGLKRLIRLRDSILVDAPVERHTVQNHYDIKVCFNKDLYSSIMKKRWNIWDDQPIENASGLCYALRKVVNTDDSRIATIEKLVDCHDRAIIFYNFDYELEILKSIDYGPEREVAEWNGHKHQPIPESRKWVYLVQYTAGCEGWNCIKTDTIIFYSQNYSYKVMVQASGRIDRLNTPYVDLYYYHLKSDSPIDKAISRALKNKKKFNETKFVKV